MTAFQLAAGMEAVFALGILILPRPSGTLLYFSFHFCLIKSGAKIEAEEKPVRRH